MKKTLLIIFIVTSIIIAGRKNDSNYFVNTEEVTLSTKKQMQETEKNQLIMCRPLVLKIIQLRK